jgi:hypothetical protein|tara:strand:- start:725 stop:1177 length:453 start_codon:yes stop_codon:yes gene_type:complete
MAKVCNCGSYDMKSLKAIREQYNTQTSSTTIGAIFSGGGVGVGAAKTSGTLAPKVAKDIENRVPKKPGIFSILLWIFITWVFLGVGLQESDSPEGGSFFFIVSAITILIVIVKIMGRKNYDKKYDHFRRTWYCFSCGNFWVYKKRVKGSR